MFIIKALFAISNKSLYAWNMKTINERLRAIRGTRSQHDMAVIVGVNPASAKQNWSYWERPGNVIPISKGMILAEAEGLTLDWIYRGIKND